MNLVDGLEKAVAGGLEKHFGLEKHNRELLKLNEALQQTNLKLQQASQSAPQTGLPLQHPDQPPMAMDAPIDLTIGMPGSHASADAAQVLVETEVGPTPMAIEGPITPASGMHGPSASDGTAQMSVDESNQPPVPPPPPPPQSCLQRPDAPSVANALTPPNTLARVKQQLHGTADLVKFKDYKDNNWSPPDVLFQGEGRNKAARMIPTFVAAVAVVHCDDPRSEALRVTPQMDFKAPSHTLAPELALRRAKDCGLSNLSEQMMMLPNRTVVEIPLEIVVDIANVGIYRINGKDDSPLSLLEARQICGLEDINPLNMEQRARIAASAAKQIQVLLLTFRYSIDNKPLNESLRFIGSTIANSNGFSNRHQTARIAEDLNTLCSSKHPKSPQGSNQMITGDSIRNQIDSFWGSPDDVQTWTLRSSRGTLGCS